MKPNNLFRTVVFTVTTAMTFLLWSMINQVFYDNLIFSIILSGFVSLGIYRSILILVEFLLIKIEFIKSKIFGNQYIEGIWIGCFFDYNDELKYFIEYFEQDFDRLVIRGRCFHSDKSYKGTWISDSVIIDSDNGKIVYTYLTDMLNNTHKNQGLAEFHFERERFENSPKRMIGFSSDLYSGRKTFAIEEKYQGKKHVNEMDLLDIASEIFIRNQEIFGKEIKQK
jgi:hypothetical protein